MTAAPECFFPADYRSARRAFIAACEARRLDAIARVVPGISGPDGKPLFMDAVAMGPRDATRALLVIGGAHGVDGYFGSAVQTGLLREGVAPPDGSRLVMIHALNPFGFAWDRRSDQDNIDVSRHAMEPGSCWSARALEAVLTEDLANVKDLVVIDCHTGLGEMGMGRMIVDAAPGSPAFARARALWGDLIVPEGAGRSRAAVPTGALGHGLARLLPGVELTFGTLVVGTVPPDAMLPALRLANRPDHFARDDARAAEVARVMRDAFYIDTPAWKRAAWGLGRACVMAALGG